VSSPGGRVGFVTAVGRALILRCPRCGATGVLDGWFKLKESCSVCALGLRRAPEDDEWFGGYFINLITSQSLMLVVVTGYVLLTWPAVPWTRVEVLVIAMIFVSSIVSYPFSKMIWVALEFEVSERAVAKNRRLP
jgi:uncharacterized protein (DUF983 family)